MSDVNTLAGQINRLDLQTLETAEGVRAFTLGDDFDDLSRAVSCILEEDEVELPSKLRKVLAELAGELRAVALAAVRHEGAGPMPPTVKPWRLYQNAATVADMIRVALALHEGDWGYNMVPGVLRTALELAERVESTVKPDDAREAA